ncbi:hypothetical protein CSC80_10670 [Maribacter sp. 6B07]|uniref:lipase family protein n=1 Tax=Maribacter sp. 6B07 TaxID=2045442 RepID=UPI000C085F46|nr:lipase family protein [Maribacter sp. 6B07]PHN93384.1 hypothetical protein CSC80_10670 [Maribacter sp. 6B07]
MSLANLILDETDQPHISGLLFASLSDIVYEIDIDTRKQRYEMLGLEECDTLFHNLLAVGDIECSILKSENKLIIVIRGSEGLDDAPNIIDWLSDASIATIPFCGTTFIHKGFASLATLLIPEILARIRIHSDIEEVWLTGHSLGGAIAQAVGYCLHTLHPIDVKRVITFGAPRIGGALKWAAPAKISNFKLDYWVNSGDPGPRVPSVGLINPLDPRTFHPVFWKHYGRLNYIDWSNSRIDFDDTQVFGPLIDAAELDFSEHKIVSYKHRIFDLMPDNEKESIKSFFQTRFCLSFLFERAATEDAEINRNNSLRSLLINIGLSEEKYSLKLLMLRFL